MQDTYKVYIKAADNGDIIAPPESTAFFTEDELAARGYVCIDEGAGDRYHHAQGNYLEKGLVDEHGRYNYRYVDGRVVEIPESEKPPVPAPGPSMMERLEALESAMLEVILDG